jgi:hypothetical protein
MLVRAMLGPEEGEDCELEVVRLAPEQLADPLQLPIGKSERAMERLFCDRRQRLVSVVAKGDVPTAFLPVSFRGKRCGASLLGPR